MIWWYYFMFWFLKMYLYIWLLFWWSNQSLARYFMIWKFKFATAVIYISYFVYCICCIIVYVCCTNSAPISHFLFIFFLSFSEFFYRHSQSFIGIFPRSWYCPEWCHCGTCLTQETSATFEATDNSSGKSFDNDKWFLEYVQRSWTIFHRKKWKCRLLHIYANFMVIFM